MPDWKTFVRRHLSGIDLHPSDEEEVAEELGRHLEDLYKAARDRGKSPAEAEAEVRAAVGSSEQLRRKIAPLKKPMATPPPPPPSGSRRLSGWFQDLVYAFRILIRRPLFSVLIVGLLALGIGASTSIFTAIQAVLLQELPLPNAARLVKVGHASSDGTPGTVGFATLADWGEESRLATLAAIRSWSPTLSTERGAERLAGMRVSWNYFSLVGVRPVLGSDFRREQDNPDQFRVVLLSHGLWQRRFGSDPTLVGRSISLQGTPYQVVGVLPPDFRPVISGQVYQPAEIWAPLGYDTSLSWACRSCQHLQAIGLLQPEAGAEQLEVELNRIQDSLNEAYPTDYSEARVAVSRLSDSWPCAWP